MQEQLFDKLWIDDTKQPPGGWYWAKSSDEAKAFLKDHVFETISFDHDLGGDDTGMIVLYWMYENVVPENWPDKIMVHSQNPVGGANLFNLATKLAPYGTQVQRVSIVQP